MIKKYHHFLKLMRGILSKTPVARKKVDQMIDNILSEIREKNNEIEDGNYETPKKEIEVTSGEEDYSKWDKIDIQHAIDQALDEEDYDKVRMLSKLPQFVKEGKVYQRELDIIKNKRNLHTK